jgi:hypothetical protein
VPAIDLPAETLDIDLFKRDSGKDRNSVIALLSVKRGVLVAKALEPLEREGIVRAFCFLQAENVRLCTFQEADHKIDPQPHRIDVPGGDLERHGVQFMTLRAEFPMSRLELSRPSTP